MGWAVFCEKEIPFENVEWGITKVLVGRTAPEGRGRSEKVLVKITEYLPGFAHKAHVHPDQDEVIFVLSGRGITETTGARREVGPGDVVHIPAGTVHATTNPWSEPLRAVIVKAPAD